MTLLLARDPRAPFALTSPVMPLDRRARGYDWVLSATALVLSLIGAVALAARFAGSSWSAFHAHCTPGKSQRGLRWAFQ